MFTDIEITTDMMARDEEKAFARLWTKIIIEEWEENNEL